MRKGAKLVAKRAQWRQVGDLAIEKYLGAEGSRLNGAPSNPYVEVLTPNSRI